MPINLEISSIGFAAGIAGNIIACKAADDIVKDYSKHPVDRIHVKMASLFSSIVFSATNLESCLLGTLFNQSFCSAAFLLEHPNRSSLMLALGRACVGSLVGYGMDQMTKEIFRSINASEEPGILINISAGVLAWNISSIAAKVLIQKELQLHNYVATLNLKDSLLTISKYVTLRKAEPRKQP